jgi:hypothetical protein
MVLGTCSPTTMWSEEKIRKPIANETVCSRASGMPAATKSGSSSEATNGSPTQPRPSEAMVMPSWQAAR